MTLLRLDGAELRCACGSLEVVCVAPGSVPVISFTSDILAAAGEPVRALCLACWPMLRGYQQELFPKEKPAGAG